MGPSLLDGFSLGILSLIGVAFGLAVLFFRAYRREVKSERVYAEAVEKKLHIPISLHPLIDTQRCIGCFACLKVCPEGDILGVVDGKAALVAPSKCIGHGRCAESCPTNAIELVFGTREQGVELPDLDEDFETSRKGVHIVGELGGMGLIKNAMTQGLRLADRFAQTLAMATESTLVYAGGAGSVDVAIVGAGPAGLATALGLQSHHLSYRLLDQEKWGGSVAHYPRQKLVMTEPVELPGYGTFGRREIKKEELLETWERILSKTRVHAEEGVKVTALTGDDGAFTLQTSAGPVHARKVVLATGRRGSPRKLGVPGEAQSKVTYRLTDARQYDGMRVLVVGGGDSALETAIQLCDDSTAEVILSYRGEAFGRCREANKQKVEALAARGRLQTLLPSTVTQIDESSVTLKTNAGERTFDNDYVIVQVGGELPTEFLQTMGVSLRQYKGEARAKKLGQEDRDTLPARKVQKPWVAHGAAKRDPAGDRERRIVRVLIGVALLVVGFLSWMGWDYYALSRTDRMHSPLHEALRPAGVFGHGIGIAATLVMMSNFLYSLRKRSPRLAQFGSMRRWLNFHVFVGVLSPIVIAFHSAFQSNNGLATATAVSLSVVVGTGLLGRFIYSLVPHDKGRELDYSETLSRWLRLRDRIGPLLEGVRDRRAVQVLLKDGTNAPKKQGSVFSELLRAPFERLAQKRALAALASEFPTLDAYEEFAESFQKLVSLRRQVGFHRALRRVLLTWRIFHIVLAVFLVVMISFHIAVSLFLGYRWVFS